MPEGGIEDAYIVPLSLHLRRLEDLRRGGESDGPHAALAIEERTLETSILVRCAMGDGDGPYPPRHSTD
ncbi:hypothetical protein CVT26_010207 [Gymnopilus dilepis]|uniref:Uncharacterized protein n=1 Tax=Gymnopilus dilepis TaxID=231916 RepID=A0A409W4N7_9AGAR|nr:hypothetical protein CVT26_010207 [Gymnopilus dilepis]